MIDVRSDGVFPIPQGARVSGFIDPVGARLRGHDKNAAEAILTVSGHADG